MSLSPVEALPDGTLRGPSFVISDEDNPTRVLAAARKRHPGKKFITRKLPGGGVRVWQSEREQ